MPLHQFFVAWFFWFGHGELFYFKSTKWQKVGGTNWYIVLSLPSSYLFSTNVRMATLPHEGLTIRNNLCVYVTL